MQKREDAANGRRDNIASWSSFFAASVRFKVNLGELVNNQFIRYHITFAEVQLLQHGSDIFEGVHCR